MLKNKVFVTDLFRKTVFGSEKIQVNETHTINKKYPFIDVEKKLIKEKM